MRVQSDARSSEFLTIVAIQAGGSTGRVRMSGNVQSLVACERLVDRVVCPFGRQVNGKGGVVGRRAVWPWRVGCTRRHDYDADTVFRAVVAGIPGRQGVPADAPGIGNLHISAKVAV